MVVQPLLGALCMAGLCAAGQANDVTDVLVDGHGADGRWFEWTIENNDVTPITYFAAPGDCGAATEYPDGWDCELLRRDDGATIECEASASVHAIRTGGRKNFRLEIKGDCRPAPQAVTIGLADGNRIEIAGVSCPARQSFLGRNFPLVGLTVMFALFLIGQAVLRRKRVEGPKSNVERQ